MRTGLAEAMRPRVRPTELRENKWKMGRQWKASDITWHKRWAVYQTAFFACILRKLKSLDLYCSEGEDPSSCRKSPSYCLIEI